MTGQQQHEGSTPRGEQEEKRKRRGARERQDDDGRSMTGMTGDRLANEHLKKDNKKAIEEHEGDRADKIVTRGEKEDIRTELAGAA